MQAGHLRELIDRAAKESGTKAALARDLGISPTRLNEWYNGHRPIPPEMAAIIADRAGLVAEEWLARATLWQAKEKAYFPMLEEALKKWLPRTGAAIAGFFLIASLSAFPRSAEAAEFHNV